MAAATAEILANRMGKVALTTASSRAKAFPFRQIRPASGRVLSSCVASCVLFRKNSETNRISEQTEQLRA